MARHNPTDRTKADRQRRFRALLKAEGGAVAATYALALFALIGIAGVGFDYARLATMDTELQNAADQAALAAATQLDGQSDSMTRATSAASALVSNNTLLSNDSKGQAITVDSVQFYATRDAAESEGAVATDPKLARFVRVSIAAREAFYALTPVVGALSSGNIDANATAGMGSAICKVPPVMMCNPGTNPATVDIDGLKGKGVLLKANGSGTWAPGDFGFLDVGAGANDLGKLLGYANPPGDCVATDMVTTEPGAMMNVINYLNTRFDIYNTVDGSANCYSGSMCPPSDNSRKDVVQEVSGGGGGTLTKNDCQLANNANQKGWKLTPAPYRPTQAETYTKQIADGDRTAWPDHMGYPRDICHAFAKDTSALAGGCGRIGDGTWDVDAYWQANYKTSYAGQVDSLSKPTRYDVYRWERSHGTASRSFASGSKNYVDYKAAMCRSPSAPAASAPDRRVIPVAVVDCTGMNGKADRAPLDFVDAFLVEPSVDRKFGGKDYTQFGDIYVEIIGRTGQGTGGSAPQFVRRDKPYLIR